MNISVYVYFLNWGLQTKPVWSDNIGLFLEIINASNGTHQKESS